MAFLRVYDALPVDMKNLSLPVLQVFTEMKGENVAELEESLDTLMIKYKEFLPAEDISFINQATDWLLTFNPYTLCELVEDL